ncbi:phage major capsid protein [Defluviimonas salinarum]|uniref:Phage major capsid protein n=1 Tax=Defluviimonas salinarum TaxID=2992147 RepID=A0ABT3IXV2_9RHOB|nr:phage major capsid protein [Defluviimonas salinarum]MCW3780272.1 phage major capsid protein [Defluviimonas salinarum]
MTHHAFMNIPATKPTRRRGLLAAGANSDVVSIVAQINSEIAEIRGNQEAEIRTLSSDVRSLQGSLAALRLGGGGLPTEVSDVAAEHRALAEFGRTGEFRAALSGDSLPDGGATVFPAVSETIRVRQFAQSALARLARRVDIDTGDSFEEPMDIGEPGADWVGERESRPATPTAKFRLLSVYANEVYSSQTITQRLLDDSLYDLGAWLSERIADKLGRKSGEAFMIGDGVNKPRGITTYPMSSADDDTRPFGTIQAHYTGVSGDFAASDPADILVDTIYSLQAQFRGAGKWVMNSKTAGVVRKFKDSVGRFLWADALAAGQPPLLLGYPVEIDEYVPDIGADASAIWFGDFSSAYLIVEKPGIRLLRDPYTNKPNVIFYAYKRVGGALSDSEALKAIVFGTEP